MLAMKRYPRSFLSLVTWGHLLVMLPLLAAVAYVFATLDTLNGRYQVAIDQVSQSTHLSGELVEDLVHMERELRRYEVLSDPDSLDDYRRVRGEWQSHLGAYLRLPPLPAGLSNELHHLAARETEAFAVLEASGNPQELRTAVEEIKQRMEISIAAIQEVLKQENDQFLRESEQLRYRLLAAAACAALTAFSCLWIIRRLIARLIGRFEHAVLDLGRGNLTQHIALDGPGDLRWLGRWLEWLRKRLLSLETSRTQVLRHVSHELKTPLAAMQEGASLLAEQIAGPLTAEQQRIIGILQSNSRRLQDLIEGLLRLQQAEHAAERIGHERLRFDQLIEQVLDTYRLIAREQQIDLASSLQETEIVAGREALTTIIHNLLSNAVKFSPAAGKVEVILKQNKDQAILDVIDQGPGIDPHDVEHLCEPFFRGKTTLPVAGIGLGLAIAREFIVAHRGKLSVIPHSDGAHFRVTLPLEANYLRAKVHH